MFGVSHGAIQFMTYEEMKNRYNQYRQKPIDTKMVRISLNYFSLTFTQKFNEKFMICFLFASNDRQRKNI